MNFARNTQGPFLMAACRLPLYRTGRESRCFLDFTRFPLVNPWEFPYALRPSSRRTLTNEDPEGIHMRQVFKNRPY
jgi:hypothetical protein